MDLSKTFDSLNHNINKLTYYGVKKSANALLRSYVSKRKQCVEIDDIVSTIWYQLIQMCHKVHLGLILFNIFINDIIMSGYKFNFILYADDTSHTTLNATVESFGETAADIQLSIRNKLQQILM